MTTLTKRMTEGSPWKLIVQFSLPIMLGNLLQQLYNTVDSVIVGQFVSSEALGAVGTCAPLTVLFLAFAIGLSTGASILIAQLFGAGRIEEMRKSVSTALILLAGFGLGISVLGYFASKPLLQHALGVPASVLGTAVTYMRIYCIGLLFQFIYNIAAAILRAVGDSRATLYFLLISSVMNIALDLLFVLSFGWGVAGAAIATVLAQLCSAAASLIYMFRRYAVLRFRREEFVYVGSYGKTMLRFGVPVALQQCMMSLGQLFIQRLVNHFGTDMMGAYTAAGRLESYVMIPILGLNAGMNVYVGQNVGAKKLDRVRTGVRQIVVVSAVICAALSLIMFTLGGQIVRIFGLEGQALALARQYVRCEAPFYIIFAVYQVAAGALQGSGDVTFATGCTVESLIIRIAASYLLAYLTPLSYAAIWWAMPIAWFAALFPAYIRYFSGAWVQKSVV